MIIKVYKTPKIKINTLSHFIYLIKLTKYINDRYLYIQIGIVARKYKKAPFSNKIYAHHNNTLIIEKNEMHSIVYIRTT